MPKLILCACCKERFLQGCQDIQDEEEEKDKSVLILVLFLTS
jgi:hypothetical protein